MTPTISRLCLIFAYIAMLISPALIQTETPAQDHNPILIEMKKKTEALELKQTPVKKLDPVPGQPQIPLTPEKTKVKKLNPEERQLQDLRILDQYAAFTPATHSFGEDDPWFFGDTKTGKLTADLFNALRRHTPKLQATMSIQGDAELADILLSAPDRIVMSKGPFLPVVHEEFARRYDSALLEIPMARRHWVTGADHPGPFDQTPYLIFRNDPLSQSSLTLKALIRFLYSKEGQTLVYKAGYRPLPIDRAQKFAILYGVTVTPSESYLQQQNRSRFAPAPSPPVPPGMVADELKKAELKAYDYQPIKGVSGEIIPIGSDALNNLMTLWLESFVEIYPAVDLGYRHRGGGTAPPALISGVSNFGPMSRLMKAKEIAKFKKKYGYEPTAFAVAKDTIGVFVHKDHPIAKRGLTLQELDAIFSSTRKGGHPSDIKTWGQLGLTGKWKDEPIVLHGRNSASPTYGFFLKYALFKGKYKDSLIAAPGFTAIIMKISKNPFSIGYAGMGFMTKDVVPVPLATEPGKAFIDPRNPANFEDYPLGRYLWLYVNVHPKKELDPLRGEFLKFIYSKQGQEEVLKAGLLPIPPAKALEELKKGRLSP